MTISTLTLPALASHLSADRTNPEFEEPSEIVDRVDSFSLSDEGGGCGSLRDDTDTAHLTTTDELSMPAVLRYPNSIKRRLIQPLLHSVGARFDAAIMKVAELDPSEARSIFQDAILSLAHRLHSSDDSPIGPADELRDYLVRLRIMRLLEAIEGRLNSMWIYPFSGLDILPSLFASRVVGIDEWIYPEQLPQSGSDAGSQLRFWKIDACAAEEQGQLARMLAGCFVAAAKIPDRYIALRQDVFGEMLNRTLSLCDDPHRLLFLKGIEYMQLHSFGINRRDQSIRTLLAMHSNPGDLVAAWDFDRLFQEAVDASGLCDEVKLDFLPNDLASRVDGSGVRAERTIVVLAPAPYLGRIHFLIPQVLRLYRHRG